MMRRRAYGGLDTIEVLVEVTEDQDNTIAFSAGRCKIDYGDGTIEYSKSDAFAEHTYASAGEYKIKLYGSTTAISTNYFKAKGIIKEIKANSKNIKTIDITLAYGIKPNIEFVDIKNCSNLTSLVLSKILFTEIDLSAHSKLNRIILLGGTLENIVLPRTSVTNLRLNGNKNLKSLDLRDNLDLTELYLGDYSSGIGITDIDVRKFLKLVTLYVGNCPFVDGFVLDCSNNSVLSALYAINANLSGCLFTDSVTALTLSINNISAINIPNNSALKTLYIDNNVLTEIDLHNAVDISHLSIFSNKITELDLSNTKEIIIAQIGPNSELATLILPDSNSDGTSPNTSLEQLYLVGCPKLEFVDLANIEKIHCLYFSGTASNVNLDNFINRTTLYTTEFVTAPYSISSKLEGISTKEMLHFVAETVKNENLYDYPQFFNSNSVLSQDETRDIYNDLIEILYKSKQRWVHNNSIIYYGGEASNPSIRNNIKNSFNISSESELDTSVERTLSISVVCKPDAEFFIYLAGNYFASLDYGDRFKFNGNLQGNSRFEVIGNTTYEVEELDDGNLKLTIRGFRYKKTYYYAYLYGVENKYESESDPYVSKIVSFEKIE